ncbi:Mitochondrial import inner membrane translocase subunit TIM50 [Aphelenchoides fujianensis]|nr:Mitochondrial import inner membrane translocase subunit TIM50 [Aphelenchoides fujianensis]
MLRVIGGSRTAARHFLLNGRIVRLSSCAFSSEKAGTSTPTDSSAPPRDAIDAAAKADVKSNSPLFSHTHNEEEAAREEKLRKAAKNTRMGLISLGLATAAGFSWFCWHYGRAPRNEVGMLMPDKHTGSILAPFYRITDGFKAWFEYATEPSREQLLPEPLKAPYFQPKYTVVIEMKNVLVAPEWTYKTGYRFKKRPALEYFLDVVGYPNFELVIYTSEPPMSAYSVVDHIDPKQRIMYRLFRDCTKYMDGQHVKDLGRLNRDLSKVIFIDFDAAAAKLNTENVLRVPKWDGDMDDTALVDLAELLKTIHLSDVEDVRPTLQYYSGFDDPPAEFRRRAHDLTTQTVEKAQPPQTKSIWQKYGQNKPLFAFQQQRAI